MANDFPEATARLRDPHSDPDYYQRLKETIDALPNNLTDQEADAILQQHGTSAKEVVNGFIEQLLRERLALQEAAEAALQWIAVQAETWTCQHSDQPMRCSRCSLRIKAKELSDQLRAALHPQGEEGK